MNKNMRNLSGSYAYIYILTLFIFAAISLYFRHTYLALGEGVIILCLLVFDYFTKRHKKKVLQSYIESVAYDSENAKSNTLLSFPLPIAVFRLNDSQIIWGNDVFFEICGNRGSRVDAKIVDLVPSFSGKWLMEGKKQYPGILELNDRKYQIHGNLVRPENAEANVAFMGIIYWIDVTDYETIRTTYENTRPVISVVVIDNFEEMIRNQPDRMKNDIRDNIEEKLFAWANLRSGVIRRYDRDRYLAFFTSEALAAMKAENFPILKEMHSVTNPNGIEASLSLGFSDSASNLQEAMQFADLAIDLALTRGGDQAVIKNKLSFEFFGGRGMEIEKRTKVKSRVMANTLLELIQDSSHVLVMGHRYSDYDAVGACVGICCIARKYGIRANIVVDEKATAALDLINYVRQDAAYKSVFITRQDAMLRADGRTLLVVVDTNRPEQVEDADLLDACNRVAVIDHHRVAATYIHNAALGFIEPFASSACELLSEILEEITDKKDVLKCEADALLCGIVLDTKNFTLRTGERTFDAASYLRRCGADTTDVKKLMQSNMQDTIARYQILQKVDLYRNVAIAVPQQPTNRVVAAKAADELLNISGVEASIVIAPGEHGGIFASARSIGELNVQIIMEKIGGGGNRSAAAAQSNDWTLEEAVANVKQAIDDYLDKT